ncbi:hypothetical protein [Caballeronia humi]|uniref:hypothetical protein n=1 Tax=Caballeronia humi TaxID=326474 RepID=UPI000F74A165|nr:hypothetical protein [Caballeronia humi]
MEHNACYACNMRGDFRAMRAQHRHCVPVARQRRYAVQPRAHAPALLGIRARLAAAAARAAFLGRITLNKTPTRELLKRLLDLYRRTVYTRHSYFSYNRERRCRQWPPRLASIENQGFGLAALRKIERIARPQ